MFGIDAALRHVVELEGSDLHAKVESPPIARVHGELRPLEGAGPLTREDTAAALEHILHDERLEREFAEGRPDEIWQCGLESPDVNCATSTWPSDRWAQLRIELHFSQLAVPVDDRLGLAIALEREGTAGADAVQFAYDHPDFRARLEVDTTTPLDE